MRVLNQFSANHSHTCSNHHVILMQLLGFMKLSISDWFNIKSSISDWWSDEWNPRLLFWNSHIDHRFCNPSLGTYRSFQNNIHDLDPDRILEFENRNRKCIFNSKVKIIWKYFDFFLSIFYILRVAGTYSTRGPFIDDFIKYEYKSYMEMT